MCSLQNTSTLSILWQDAQCCVSAWWLCWAFPVIPSQHRKCVFGLAQRCWVLLKSKYTLTISCPAASGAAAEPLNLPASWATEGRGEASSWGKEEKWLRFSGGCVVHWHAAVACGFVDLIDWLRHFLIEITLASDCLSECVTMLGREGGSCPLWTLQHHNMPLMFVSRRRRVWGCDVCTAADPAVNLTANWCQRRLSAVLAG